MKKFKLLLFLFIIFFISCNKTIEEPVLVSYTPNNLDLNAGTWKTYVLVNATEIKVESPASVGSVDYKAELSTLKATLSSLSKSQKNAVQYWSAGAVYRWNEIARELAAKYNLPPVANAQGIYPVPDRNNPLAEPKFPFANPPYTARALAYLSVAQYDALVAAYFWKKEYGRKSPSKNDSSIIPSKPVTDLPSYPSEEAVIASASYAILLNMFPGEGPFLEAKLAEAKNVGLWAGTNVPSDLVAGEALGKAVAAKILSTKVATDGMGAANNQSLVEGFIESAKSRGLSVFWKSQEIPIRPPMLPNYGAVKTWHLSKSILNEIRPVLPYAIESIEWKKELEELKAINKNQTREQAKLANYWSDGAGSYTPPGHWHRIAASQSYDNKESEIRMARTLAAMGTALMDAGIACWETKYFYLTPRPQQYGIKTSVGLPNFPSYTSGHSTFSAAAAQVLCHLYPKQAETYKQAAKDASDSRIFGLIHFRADCQMGLEHGEKIGNYAINFIKKDGSE